MLTILIGLLTLILLVVGISNGAWLEVGVIVAGALLLLGLCSSSRESDRAYLNMVDYWAKRK